MTQQPGVDVGAQPSFLTNMAQAASFYRTLNVDPTASRLAIRESYLRLKNMYQSGNDGLYGLTDGTDLQRQLSELEEAFNVLNDDYKRSNYDRSIGVGVNTGHSAIEHSDSPANSYHGHSDTIQTNRSTLRIIKTRALRADDPLNQEKINSLLAEADIGDGTLLARLRQILEVSEAEMQNRTKISLEYIRSMENNRFDRLPQVVYVKGFIRSYLRYLCIPNPEEIIKAFAARLEAWQLGSKQ
jgi:curved DNA-binding protein CbpA